MAEKQTIVISKRLIAVNSASSVLARILNITVLVWMYQYLLKNIPAEEFAVYPVVTAIMVFAPLFFAFLTSGVSRHIVDAYARDDLEDVRRITAASSLPLLVDADTGWGGAFNIARTIQEMIRAGAAGVHIEDQVAQKRCGHRPNKAIVDQQEMVDRIKAAADARVDPGFVIMARTDALAVEGMSSALDRVAACVEAGADMVFPEAMTELPQYKEFCAKAGVPVLANLTEFGQTPLFTLDELKEVGVAMALYPLTAVRAMNRAAENVYKALIADGTQRNVVDTMQTRMELYDYLNYHDFERKLDELFAGQ